LALIDVSPFINPEPPTFASLASGSQIDSPDADIDDDLPNSQDMTDPWLPEVWHSELCKELMYEETWTSSNDEAPWSQHYSEDNEPWSDCYSEDEASDADSQDLVGSSPSFGLGASQEEKTPAHAIGSRPCPEITFADDWDFPLQAGPYVPFSMKNFGATCFVNAALQCLFSVQSFRDFLFRNDVQSLLNGPKSKSLSFLRHCRRLLSSTRDAVRQTLLHDLPSVLDKAYHSNFNTEDHEDTNDFILAVIECLDGELSRAGLLPSPVSQILSGDEGTDRVRHKNIGCLFEVMQSTHKVCKQGHYSSCLEPGLFLSLPLRRQATRAVKLEDCIADFVNPAPQDSENLTWCNICELLSDVKHFIAIAPPVLPIRLLRYCHERKGEETTPITIATRVTVPMELRLDATVLDPHGTRRQANYRLLGRIDYSGDGREGHYVCWVRSGSRWYFCNDSEVNACPSPPLVASRTVYCLFYELIDD
jgi:ubiquitin C-terminal hydrolase